MGLAALILVALALSVDNFTTAVAVGAQAARRTPTTMLQLPIVFAVFATIAPALGWYAGSQMATAVARYGGVLACAILVYVGWQTLRSARNSVSTGRDTSSLGAALALGLGTSMDSLTVGFAMALTHVNVVSLAAVNGAVCFILSLAGMLAGERIGESFPTQSKVAAGFVLMAIGLRALLAVHP